MPTSEYTAATYGDAIADDYDALYASVDPAPAVDFLAPLAAGGRALELGIGTGRVAIPLAARGVDVRGVDASEAMVRRMRLKPGGEGIPVTIGDFTSELPDGPFALAYAVFSTLFALPSQDAQVRCFRNVAARLGPAGRFVVEAYVPDLARFVRGQCTHTVAVEPDHVQLSFSRHEPLAQRIVSQYATISPRGVKLYPVQARYAFPAELDLMARLAGLTLRERLGDFGRAPFTAASAQHVSVYGWP